MVGGGTMGKAVNLAVAHRHFIRSGVGGVMVSRGRVSESPTPSLREGLFYCSLPGRPTDRPLR